ncbi:hypothetical protein MHU86_6749 [Fragilaria crotonensis]|nr:hypothetical protein MHU86_6749 [Fragilaria crotonensis]
MKSTRRSINAINNTIGITADEDGASVTTGASLKSCNPNCTTSNDGREVENDLNPAGPIHNQVTVDDNQEGEDKMPQDWTFPGFISFVLLGPIVIMCLLPYYRSEIMMPTLLPTIRGDTSNGRAAMRKERVLSKSCKKAVVATSPSKAPAVSLQQKNHGCRDWCSVANAHGAMSEE